MSKSYLYFYKGKFTTENGLKDALIKDGVVWISRGTFYYYEPASSEEIYYQRDYLRDILFDTLVINKDEYDHFQKWINDKTKEGTLKVRKNCTWYHCEENDGMGTDWDDCLENILWTGDVPIENEEQVIEDYCQTLTEEEFKTFCRLSEVRQSTIAQKWRIEKYAQENR